MAKNDEVLTVLEIDGETGEVTERPLTAAELTARKALAAQIAEQEAEAKAKEEARASALTKLAALGLTEEEIATL